MYSPTAIKRMNAAIEYAATGDLKKVKHYVEKNRVAINTYIEMVRIASLKGQVDVLQYLFTIEDVVDNLMVNRNFPSLFATACHSNQLNVVKFFAPLMGEKEMILGINNSAFKGHKEVLQYLLTSEELPNKVHVDKTKALTRACENNQISIVRYLLTVMGANIHINEDEPLKAACSKNRKSIVKYLLTSKKLKDHADINATDDTILPSIVSDMHHDLVQYLLSSPELKKHANINLNAIETACYVEDDYKMLDILLNHLEKSQQSDPAFVQKSQTRNDDAATYDNAINKIFLIIKDRESLSLAQHLIINRNLPYQGMVERTLQVWQHLDKKEPGLAEFAQQLDSLFKNRELKEQLEQDLPINDIKQKRVKI